MAIAASALSTEAAFANDGKQSRAIRTALRRILLLPFLDQLHYIARFWPDGPLGTTPPDQPNDDHDNSKGSREAHHVFEGQGAVRVVVNEHRDIRSHVRTLPPAPAPFNPEQISNCNSARSPRTYQGLLTLW